MRKTVKCPKCEHTMVTEGEPGESKTITCPNCGLKGNFTFKEDFHKSSDYKNLQRDYNGPKSRPLGVTILAALQIIGTIILIPLLFIIPIILGEKANEVLGFPIIEFLIIYSFIMIPISLLLAYGLLKGKEWARFSSVLFQISSIISSIVSLNILGIIIPIFIIIYLYKPHVKKFFKTDKGVKMNIKIAIIVGISILIILNCYIVLLTNPYFNQNIKENQGIPDERYYGTWHNTAKGIEMTFYRNNSLFIKNETKTFKARWKNTKDMFNSLLIDWGEQKIKYVPLFLETDRVEFMFHMNYWDNSNYSFFNGIELNKVD